MGKISEIGRVWRWLGRYGRDRRGNISAMMALLIVPLVGVMGVATETGNWFLIQRSMQNAADSAAIAAATNANATNNSYQLEGKSVATNFGYTNGANSTTVTIVNNDNTVPAKCGGACYAVTITRTVPVFLTRVVGLGATQAVTAKAVAVPQNVPTSYCLVSLGAGDAFHINGGNSVDLNGCNVFANGDTTCNGNNSNGGANSITYGPGASNKKCTPSVAATAPLTDPYASLAASIPPKTCGAPSPQTFTNTTIAWGTNGTPPHFCGDVTINGTVTVNTPSTGSLMVIEDGNLIVNGTLATSGSSALTVLFTGTNAGSHIMTGGGTLDISAPLAGSGTWSGMAIYQDPALTSGVDMANAGNAPTWNISGVIYVPNSDLLFKGIVNKANNGLDCFVLVDSTFQSSGTGTILENQSRCGSYGVTLPTTSTLVRTTLVY